jgi:DNA-binding beta-propeller fold protein YncE
VIDVTTGIVNYNIAVPEPIDVVFNATGTVAYISSRSPGSVLVVNAATYAAIKNIPTRTGASDLLLSADGGLLTVNNFDDNSITDINTTALTVLDTTPANGSPIGVSLVPVE